MLEACVWIVANLNVWLVCRVPGCRAHPEVCSSTKVLLGGASAPVFATHLGVGDALFLSESTVLRVRFFDQIEGTLRAHFFFIFDAFCPGNRPVGGRRARLELSSSSFVVFNFIADSCTYSGAPPGDGAVDLHLD